MRGVRGSMIYQSIKWRIKPCDKRLSNFEKTSSLSSWDGLMPETSSETLQHCCESPQPRHPTGVSRVSWLLQTHRRTLEPLSSKHFPSEGRSHTEQEHNRLHLKVSSQPQDNPSDAPELKLSWDTLQDFPRILLKSEEDQVAEPHTWQV